MTPVPTGPIQSEPLLTVGVITAAVSAALVFAKTMGLNITNDQQEAIRNLVAVLAPLILAGIARQLVFSPAGAQKVANIQYQAGLPPTEAQPDVPSPADVK